MLLKILLLARGKPQTARARPAGPYGPLRDSAAQRPFLGAKVQGQLLYRPHIGIS